MAFLQTVTATLVTTDARWSDPFAAATAAEPVAREAAVALALTGAHPVRGTLGLAMRLAAAGPAEVALYDLQGRRVATVATGNFPAGTTALAFDASALTPGLYVARLTGTGGTAQVPLVRAR